MNGVLLGHEVKSRGWFDLVEVRFEIAGKRVDRLIVDHPSGATVLAYDPERRVAAVVSEARSGVLYLGLPPLLEGAGGVVDAASEAPEAAARREAEEELGLRLTDLELVGSVMMTPSTTTERVWLYIAAYSPADRVSAGGGMADEDEHLDVREVPLALLWREVSGGGLADAKLLMMLQGLRLRRPELFG